MAHTSKSHVILMIHGFRIRLLSADASLTRPRVYIYNYFNDTASSRTYAQSHPETCPSKDVLLSIPAQCNYETNGPLTGESNGWRTRQCTFNPIPSISVHTNSESDSSIPTMQPHTRLPTYQRIQWVEDQTVYG